MRTGRAAVAPAGPPVSAEAVVAAVRVHADRVHDLVRRQGCPAAQAPEVVGETALELVGRAARERLSVPVLVGQWCAAAAERARAAGPAQARLPVGSGPLADDAQQRLLAEVLDAAPEPARTALLLSDAYDLPLATVAAALQADPDDAALLLGRARLAVLPQLFTPDGAAVPSTAGHPTDEPGLARLAAGGPPAPPDATTARHAHACSRCRAVVEAQEDVRRLLAGLSVVALPDDDREALLDRVAERAGALLPGEAALLAAAAAAVEDEDDEPRRLLSPLPVLLSLGLAVVGGVGLGVLLSQTATVDPAEVALLPAVTPPPLTPLPARPRATAAPQPSTRVFTLRPTTPPPPTTRPPTSAPPTTAPPTTPPATATPSATPTPTATATAEVTAIDVEPAAGEAGATVVVTGTGWQPGSVVSVAYLRPDGTRTGSTATAEVDDDGAFRTSLLTRDRRTPTGAHGVLASDGTTEVRAAYTAS